MLRLNSVGNQRYKAIREFAWDTLADNYIELVKGRLYTGGASRKSALLVLHTAFDALCKMLAPFTPYFAEECYSHLNSGASVHQQPWVSFPYEDDAARYEGDLLAQVVAEVRKYKHDCGLALNAPLGKVTIYAPHTINDEGDTGRTLNADVHWRTDAARLERVITDIDFNRAVIGPVFRKQAPAFGPNENETSKSRLLQSCRIQNRCSNYRGGTGFVKGELGGTAFRVTVPCKSAVAGTCLGRSRRCPQGVTVKEPPRFSLQTGGRETAESEGCSHRVGL